MTAPALNSTAPSIRSSSSGLRVHRCTTPDVTELQPGVQLSGAVAAVALADDLDVLRLGPLLTLRDVELDPLPFIEAAVAATCDRAEVHEHIWATFDLDETVALVAVEPLHRALRHFDLPRSGCAPATGTERNASHNCPGQPLAQARGGSLSPHVPGNGATMLGREPARLPFHCGRD